MDARAKRAVSNEQAELLRQIPSVDELLLQPRLAALSNRVDRSVVVEVARAVLADPSRAIAGDSNWSAIALNPGSWKSSSLLRGANSFAVAAAGNQRPPVILHTNLGRAPLRSRVEEFRRTATQIRIWNTIWKAGARGKRDAHTTELLTRLTGAESAIVVNNCAAAVLVILASTWPRRRSDRLARRT